jgi:hypothetical protein
MDNLRRFPAPWVMVEEEQCFRVNDTNGFSVCSVPTAIAFTGARTSTPSNL